MRIALGLAALLSGAATGGAAAQDNPPYLDDRSAPQTLVRSLYNAIDRSEFGRAWEYFSAKPAADVETYAKGFEAVGSVEVVVGAPSSMEDAASMLHILPVAISTVDAAGKETIGAGCYVIRSPNHDAPGGTYQPMAIESAEVLPTDKPLLQALPTTCGTAQVTLPPQNAVVEKARALFLQRVPGECFVETDNEPQAWEIRFRATHDAPTDAERVATLIRFFCTRGAYNETTAYYLADEYGAVRALSFAAPELDIRYQGEGDATLESMTVIGFTSASGLVNAEYDPGTLTLRSHSYWRGIGDASSIGSYMFRDGDFTLVRYDVDPTFDDKVEHQTVVEYDLAP